MRAVSRRAIEPLAHTLLETLADDVRHDVVYENPTAAIEVHYAPVRVRALPAAALVGDQCSTEGFYDATIDPLRPWIFYANDTSPRRARFTLLHELGHHLVVTEAPELLDELDELGGSATAALKLEEALCHRFAGTLLVPDELLADLANETVIEPNHVQEVHERAETASWDAVAVRVSEHLPGPGAIVLLRDEGVISFCWARGLENTWWGRGNTVKPGGPLSRAFRVNQKAQPEVYRWNLGYERQLFCDTLRIHDALVLAVLCTKRSDGGLSILEEIEPAWKQRESWCERCNEERSEGWCEFCRDRHCPECGRCACNKELKNPLCPECGLVSPFRKGATMCRTCEQDRGLL